MVFFEPPRGTAEAVNMSDDNSDGISTDGDDNTPPEYYRQTPAITYECITYDGKEGIVLYPYDPNSATGRNENVSDENTPKEPLPSTSSAERHFQTDQRDIQSIANVRAFRARLNDYINSNVANISGLYSNTAMASSDSSSDGDLLSNPGTLNWSTINTDPVTHNPEDSQSPASSSHS